MSSVSITRWTALAGNAVAAMVMTRQSARPTTCATHQPQAQRDTSQTCYEGMTGREGCAVVACPATKEIESMSASTSTCRHVSQLASVSGTPSNPSLPSPASRQW